MSPNSDFSERLYALELLSEDRFSGLRKSQDDHRQQIDCIRKDIHDKFDVLADRIEKKTNAVNSELKAYIFKVIGGTIAIIGVVMAFITFILDHSK